MRLFLLTLFVLCFAPHSAWAEDYLLKVETLQTREEVGSKKPPEKTGPLSMESVIQLDRPFHNKVCVGKKTLTLAGKLRLSEDERLILDVEFEELTDTGAKVAVKVGVFERLLDTSAISSTIGLELEKPRVFGEFTTKQDQPGGPGYLVETRFLATLTKYKPSNKKR